MQTEKKSEYIVDLNHELPLNYVSTTIVASDQKIEDQQFFMPAGCFFNFNEDRIEFTVKCPVTTFKKLIINENYVWFIIPKSRNSAIPISLNEAVLDSNKKEYTLKIHANFKDQILDLFEDCSKIFTLSIFFAYKNETNNEYEVLFVASFPNKANLLSCDPRENVTVQNPSVQQPHLKKLFQHNFSFYTEISQEEAALLKDLKEFKNEDIYDRFGRFDFLKMFNYMIEIEELNNAKTMRQFNADSVDIYKYNSCPVDLQETIKQHLSHLMCQEKMNSFVRTICVIKAQKKMPIDIMDFDVIYILDQLAYENKRADYMKLRISGRIVYMFDDIILVRLKQKQIATLNENRKYRIEFAPNRNSTDITRRALEIMKQSKMSSYLKYFEMKKLPKITSENFKDFEWFNSEIVDNDEQQIAVESIVNCKSFPSPFIIFGGPGTGKSATIVEAIAQIVKLKPTSRILVTASSNATCDEIGRRLVKYISVNKILRLYSPSFEAKPEKIDEELQKISNFRARKCCPCLKRSCPQPSSYKNLSSQEFSTARVVITTLVRAGRVNGSEFDADHFDYIFIDEAGSVSEPQTYIPISELGLTENRVHAQIVLSGDHKQLGPTVKEPFACDLGLGVSLMERLMNTDQKYKLQGNDYDHNYVVQLKQNYRNHPGIMKFSNLNFYNNKLVPKCSDKIKNFGLKLDWLPDKNLPIIFHSVNSQSTDVGTSLKNEGERTVVLEYLQDLLTQEIDGKKVEESDIGIISPYKAQRDRMIREFGEKYPKVEIGTVDAFQGREKKIILVSCVRSGMSSVGFLENEKRLNVTLTRAQSLLIIIGNVPTLQKSDIFAKFIDYCKRYKVVIGDQPETQATVNARKKVQNKKAPDTENKDTFDGMSLEEILSDFRKMNCLK